MQSQLNAVGLFFHNLLLPSMTLNYLSEMCVPDFPKQNEKQNKKKQKSKHKKKPKKQKKIKNENVNIA